LIGLKDRFDIAFGNDSDRHGIVTRSVGLMNPNHLDLLAAEITAATGRDPGEHYQKLTKQSADPVYERSDVVATPAQKAVLERLSPEMVTARDLAGEKIIVKLTRAPFNAAASGGLKVVTESGWFAARPSGTEDIYKIYAESFRGDEHLKQIFGEAQEIVAAAFREAGL
jgi:phosphoglucomutase